MLQQQEEDGNLNSAVSFCPSFNSYSTDKLVEIADKVSKESNDEKSKLKSKKEISNYEDDEEDDDDFEFNRLFFNGEIHEVFPVFNRDLLLNDRGSEERHVAALKNLFIVDDDDDDGDQGRRASSSSSDADEPEIQQNAIFCVWSPKRNPSPLPSPSPSPSRCKKSNSTGSSSSSSKKWFKFRDLLKRSNSDGKESYVFLNKPAKSNKNKVDSKDKKVKSGKVVSAHEAFYVKNRAIKEGDKKKTYLPYKQDLLGVFTNHNALGRTLPH